MAATEPTLGKPNPKPKRSWPSRILRACMGLCISFLLIECSLHFLMLSDNPTIAKATRRLRVPDLWSDFRYESDYWKLSHLWSLNTRKAGAAPNADPVLGWRPNNIREDYSVKLPDPARGRRPVVLYGDSFARGLTAREDTYQGLFMASEMGRDHVFFNHGVGGFGLGQTYLMMLNSIESYADHDPVVILSFLVPDDLYRIGADFRAWAKPHFTAEDGELVFNELATNDPAIFLDDNPLEIWSWTWRGLLYGTNFWPTSWSRKLRGQAKSEAQLQEVTELLLAEAKNKLDSLGIEWFVLIFQAEPGARESELTKPEEKFARDALHKLDIPFVTTRPDLWDFAKEHQASLSTLYLQPPNHGAGHYNANGNRATLNSILRGMNGDFDTEFRAGPRPPAKE
jgi:hypothetical protein